MTIQTAKKTLNRALAELRQAKDEEEIRQNQSLSSGANMFRITAKGRAKLEET